MRPLRYSINLTLDGCCSHEVVEPTEEMHQHFSDRTAQADALLYGRVVHEMMESAWRPIAETGEVPDGMADWVVPFAQSIHAAKKYVVSDTLESVDWNAEIIRGKDLRARVEELKAEDGDGLMTGGVTLARALAEMGLIDRYEFVVHPRIVGHGPYLLGELPSAVDLKLVNKRELDGGMLVLDYEPRR